jgi:hypothetical protein
MPSRSISAIRRAAELFRWAACFVIVARQLMACSPSRATAELILLLRVGEGYWLGVGIDARSGECMPIEAVLRELASLLYGYNYAVFVQSYLLPTKPEATIEDYITQVLPHAEVGGMQLVSEQDVLILVEQALRYAGNEGSGPKPAALNSPKFEELLGDVLAHLKHVGAEATTITSFWLKSGHPAYPVFWDFAFVFVGKQAVELFIGSSSD